MEKKRIQYYLINNTIKKGEKMPIGNGKYFNPPFEGEFMPKPYSGTMEIHRFNKDKESWLSSLQPCEISESELDKINNYVFFVEEYNGTPIDVTDIVKEIDFYSEVSGHTYKIIKFKQPKQVDGEIEAVYGYIAIKDDVIISGIYNHLHRIQEDYPKSEIYEIFKNRK